MIETDRKTVAHYGGCWYGGNVTNPSKSVGKVFRKEYPRVYEYLKGEYTYYRIDCRGNGWNGSPYEQRKTKEEALERARVIADLVARLESQQVARRMEFRNGRVTNTKLIDYLSLGQDKEPPDVMVGRYEIYETGPGVVNIELTEYFVLDNQVLRMPNNYLGLYDVSKDTLYIKNLNDQKVEDAENEFRLSENETISDLESSLQKNDADTLDIFTRNSHYDVSVPCSTTV